MAHCVNFDKWLRSSDAKQWKANRPVVNDSRLGNPEKDASRVNRKDPFPTERVRTDGMAISTHSVPAKQLSPVMRDVSWGTLVICRERTSMKQPSARKKVCSFGRSVSDTTRVEFATRSRFSSSDNPTLEWLIIKYDSTLMGRLTKRLLPQSLRM